MFAKRMFLLIATFVAALAFFCFPANAADDAEKDWLSDILKWDAWNIPFSKTSKVAGMRVVGKTETGQTICVRKKESLKGIAKGVRIVKVYYIYDDAYAADGVTVADKQLYSVVMEVHDEDTYTNDGIYSDKGVVAAKLPYDDSCLEGIDDDGWHWGHTIKYKLDRANGVAYEKITVSDGENEDGQWAVSITFVLIGAG
jgi:hypothetical protein